MGGMPKHTASDITWAVNDFGLAKLGDERLVKRLQTIATDLSRHPAMSIPEACGGWDKTKAAYRFFANESVTAQAIMDAHAQATLQRACGHKVVLCLQDTTTLNYSAHPRTKGLGPISNNRDKTLGLFLHSTLAVTPAGQPLGLLHAQVLARDGRKYGRSSMVRNALPLEQKESRKWLESHRACQALAAQCPGTMLVNLADREGDIYDLFAQALAPESKRRVQLLVRAQHNRQVDQPQKYLWDFLAAQSVTGQIKITVPRQTAQPARLATLAIRFTQVTLRSPCLKEEQPSLGLWAVEARELHPPTGAKAICWRLLTTLPVTCLEEAVEKIRWYAQRWQIEVMHKVLKSGCQIERRQLETVERLKRLLMVDLVVAWRVMALCKAGRETPAGLAGDWLSSQEWQALSAYKNQGASSNQPMPDIVQAVRWIAQLGGFLARKGDGDPGPIVIWRGLRKLSAITEAWQLFQNNKCG